MSTTPWLDYVRRLASIAQIGLTYATDPYDRERYEQLRDMAVEMASAYSEGDPAIVNKLFTSEPGYPTPKVDVRGVVFRDDKVLLVREAADGLWTLPGGWADVGDTPRRAVEREIWEESGFEARATKLLAVYDRDNQGHPAYEFAIYKLFFQCEIVGGRPAISHETLDVAFFGQDALPELSTGRVLAQQIHRFFDHYRSPGQPTDFD